MSELTVERKPKKSDLTAADVANYLRHNPEFFLNRPEILFDMALPHGQNNAASLLERQAAVLRTRNTELRHKLNELVSVARDNDRLFNQIKKLGLELLEAGSLKDAANALHHSLQKDFDLDHSQLLIFKPTLLKGAFSVCNQLDVQRTLGDLLRGERIICTTLRKQEMQFLFPQYPENEGSAALIPLHFQGELGLLAIGSQDANHFNSNMDTTFARYIGDILSRRLFHFLN